MVYDAIDHYVVLFGGVNTTTGQVYNDTWVFTGQLWIQLAISQAPSPRYGAGSTWAYAVTSSGSAGHFGYVELFGGEDDGALLGDTWEFLGGVWTQVDFGNLTQPLPAAYTAMSCNFNDGYPVLVGGMDSTAGSPVYGTVEGSVWVYR